MTEKIDYEWKIIHDGQGKTPNIRINSSSFVYKDHLYLVCGASAGLGKSSEVWRYHLGNNEWENCKCNGESPNVRDGHSCSYIGNGKFIVFGGQGFPYPNSKLGKSAESSKVKTYLVRELYNDLYEFNCDNLTWTPIYPDGLNFPMGRRGHVAMFIDSLDCMRSDYKRGNSANIHGPNHYSSDAHSAYDGQSVYSSSTGVATRMSSVKQGSRITANTTADSFDGNLNNAIPGNSLLVFGGSGIELSKYTEQLYNDLWLFSLGTKQWSRHETRGVEPRPMFDHRVERVGDVLVVVGGITTPTKPNFTNIETVQPTDVITLDLRTSTWTYLQLWNEHGKIARFNFHGCSLVADAFKDPSILFVFGGREIIDVKTASKSKSITALKGIDCYTHIINIEDATITPVVAKNSPPSSRYGHIGITTVSVDSNSHPSHGIQMKYRKKKDKKSKKGGFLDMLTEMKIDRVMFVYGGSANESGGFCDPILYELDRVKSTGEPLTLFIDKQDEQSKIGGNQSVADMSGISGHYSSKFGGLSPTGSVYSQADVANTLDTRGSIWTSMQQQGGAKPDSVRQPSNWNELKLALSSPLSFRVTDSAESEVFNTRQGTSSSSRFGTRDSPRTIGSRLPTASLLDRVGTGYLPRNEGRLTHSAPLLQRASTSKIASRSNLLTAPISLRNSGIYNNSQKTMRAQTSPGFSRQFAGSRELSSAGALTMGEIGMEESHVMQEASIPLNHRDLTPKEIKRDKIKNISQSLKPVIKNKTKIEARDVYQQLYPFPSHMQPGKYW